MEDIILSDITKTFVPSRSVWQFIRGIKEDNEPVFCLDNISLTIPAGKTTVIIGPTGCGKTTLLKIIAGLIHHDTGKILYGDKELSELPPGERRIGMVFQNYALYPHFNVKDNIMSYFFFKKLSKNWTEEDERDAEEKYRRTSRLLDVKLEHLSGRFPKNLSGGEKQRVAIGRCITRDPRLFLMDEPFSNLDQPLREKYRVQLKKLLSYFNITTIYVTHDQHEALLLADKIVVMREGRIEQEGSPEELYENPRNIFVAEFLNPHRFMQSLNLIPGDILSDEYLGRVIGIRPEYIDIPAKKSVKLNNVVKAEVKDIGSFPLDNKRIIKLELEDSSVIETEAEGDFRIGETVEVSFSRFFVFDSITGERIATHIA
ncbi:ABC transporter ATP-binding protein [Spirochaetia bacterium 38H-sp]|uniref:ABC transporter ATP-binding protein n=1 Tax=Rarispira pelagica TaxID=3141764 RepID=A0ABU9UAR9_9SPIR